jgi:hypothetical protein
MLVRGKESRRNWVFICNRVQTEVALPRGWKLPCLAGRHKYWAGAARTSLLFVLKLQGPCSGNQGHPLLARYRER